MSLVASGGTADISSNPPREAEGRLAPALERFATPAS
jgi:hypothetical protein